MKEGRVGLEERCKSANAELTKVLEIDRIEESEGSFKLMMVIRELGGKIPYARSEDHVLALLDAQIGAITEYEKERL